MNFYVDTSFIKSFLYLYLLPAFLQLVFQLLMSVQTGFLIGRWADKRARLLITYIATADPTQQRSKLNEG